MPPRPDRSLARPAPGGASLLREPHRSALVSNPPSRVGGDREESRSRQLVAGIAQSRGPMPYRGRRGAIAATPNNTTIIAWPFQNCVYRCRKRPFGPHARTKLDQRATRREQGPRCGKSGGWDHADARYTRYRFGGIRIHFMGGILPFGPRPDTDLRFGAGSGSRVGSRPSALIIEKNARIRCPTSFTRYCRLPG
jgi:hypothetical protein